MSASWPTLVAEHDAELSDFIVSLRAVPAENWNAARDDGAWTPAQIAQHILSTYTVLQRELDGGEGLRVKVPWYIRPVLRAVFLRRILRRRPLGRRATAPRATRPTDTPPKQGEAPALLQTAASRAIESLEQRHRRGERGVTHPYFGHVKPPDAVRFLAWHAWHHRQQVDARSGRAV